MVWWLIRDFTALATTSVETPRRMQRAVADRLLALAADVDAAPKVGFFRLEHCRNRARRSPHEKTQRRSYVVPAAKSKRPGLSRGVEHLSIS